MRERAGKGSLDRKRVGQPLNQPPRGNRSNPYARARLRAGLTQAEAVRKLHISAQLLSGIENNKMNPTPDIAMSMAKLYGDDRLPRKICREVCAIGRARALPFELNLEVVIPLMWAKLDELGETLDQLLEMVREKESFQDYSPAEWEALTECAELMRRFARDMEILEISVDRYIEQAEKKTACAAKR